MNILLIGVTGTIGGHLVSFLIDEGHKVRVLVRDPSRIRGKAWGSKVEVVSGDLVENRSLDQAVDGIDVAYYLVSSIRAGAYFEHRDRQAARNFVSTARGKIKHIIYLGSLLPNVEIGQILGDGISITEFRAGPIIGKHSAPFEMLRHLTERLPIMIAPRWVRNQIHPIALRDVLSYLCAALAVLPEGIIEIGGADRLTFKQMMEIYAQERKLHREILAVPLSLPTLASRWVGLVTPIPYTMALHVIQSIANPVVADTKRARRYFPHIHPMGHKQALRQALQQLGDGEGLELAG